MRIEITIPHTLIQAMSIEEFKKASGRRQMNMPYWLKIENTWIFEFVNEDTNVVDLVDQIEKGIVFIRKQDAKEI